MFRFLERLARNVCGQKKEDKEEGKKGVEVRRDFNKLRKTSVIIYY